MGKFDQVVAGLPRITPEVRYSGDGGANYQFKLDEAKEAYQDRKPSVLLTQYARMRARVDRIESLLKKRKVQVEALSQLIVEAYEGHGITSMKVDKVGTLRTDYVPYSHVVDKSAYYTWCMENGFGPQMMLPWQTTNSVTKERLLSGEDAPPGIEVYVKPTPVFTREK